jgi:hypothetical protein
MAHLRAKAYQQAVFDAIHDPMLHQCCEESVDNLNWPVNVRFLFPIHALNKLRGLAQPAYRYRQ